MPYSFLYLYNFYTPLHSGSLPPTPKKPSAYCQELKGHYSPIVPLFAIKRRHCLMVTHLHLPLPPTLRKHRQIRVGRRTVRLTLAVLSMWRACPEHSRSTTANRESKESAFLIPCGNFIITCWWLDSNPKEGLISTSGASY